MDRNLIVNRNNIMFQASTDLQKFCQSFFNKTQLKYFCHIRQYFNDGSASILTTLPELCEETLSSALYPANLMEFSALPPKIILTEKLLESLPNIDPKISSKLKSKACLYREKYNCDYILTFVKKEAYYCDFFQFAADGDNINIINFYINELDFISRFQYHFLLHKSELIKSAYDKTNRIQLPKFENFINVSQPSSDDKKDFIINEQQNKRKYLFEVDQKIIYLSKREYNVLIHLIQGKTAQQTADLLCLSRRTVEAYLDCLREKMFARNKFELIAKAMPFYLNFYHNQ